MYLTEELATKFNGANELHFNSRLHFRGYRKEIKQRLMQNNLSVDTVSHEYFQTFKKYYRNQIFYMKQKGEYKLCNEMVEDIERFIYAMVLSERF